MTPGTAPAAASASADQVAAVDPFALSILVKDAVNLRGSKGEKVSTFVRVQFADFGENDSPPVPDTPNPAYNHTHKLELPVTEGLIDTVLNYRLSVSVFEVLPKDKTAVLGSGEASLSDLLLSVKELAEDDPAAAATRNMGGTVTIPIEYQNPKLLGPSEDQQVKPAVTIEVSVNRPLVPWAELETANIVQFCPVELAPVPDEWNPKEVNEKDPNSNLFNYTLSMTLPLDAQQDRPFQVPLGCLVANTPAAASSTADPAASAGGPSCTKKVQWQQPFRTLLSSVALKKLRERILSKTPFDVELCRVPQAKYAGVTDPLASRYRGRTTLDLSMLMLPEAVEATVSGAVTNVEVDEKDASLVQLKARITQYKSCEAKLTMAVKLHRPLLDKKRLTISNRSIFDFIPRRALPPQQIYTKRVAIAQSEYRAVVQQLIRDLAHEFHAVSARPASGPGATGGGSHDVLAQARTGGAGLVRVQQSNDAGAAGSGTTSRADFLRHVQLSGLYHKMHERLKVAVVQLLREQYRHFFDDPAQRMALMAQVYVQLVDTLNAELAKWYRIHPIDSSAGSAGATASTSPMATATASDAELVQLAEACEADLDFAGAHRWLTERMVREPDNLQAQYALAASLARSGDADRAKALLQQILGRHPSHVPALIALGVLASAGSNEREHALAETCLMSAMRTHPADSGAMGSTLLALMAAHYAVVGDDDRADSCQAEAARAGDADMFLRAAETCVGLGCAALAERLLGYDLVQRGGVAPTAALMLRATLYAQMRRHDVAEACLKTALQRQLDDAAVWARLGHLHRQFGKPAQAKAAYESLLAFHPDSADRVVGTRLGEIYFVEALEDGNDWGSPAKDADQIRAARELYVKSEAWAGVGLACMALGQMEEAEASFCHATASAPRESTGWAALALLHLRHDRILEGEQAVSYVLHLGCRHVPLLRSCAMALHRKGRSKAATECLEAALEINSTDPPSRELMTAILSSSIAGKLAEKRSLASTAMSNRGGAASAVGERAAAV
ncbi:hypothetical protein H9P43_003538 [Blastocladiella emersonii ATCC 22665]|nr:hypothetical protein H9P43_003538 [Blastocladiella emersonii ATCC 22665]